MNGGNFTCAYTSQAALGVGGMMWAANQVLNYNMGFVGFFFAAEGPRSKFCQNMCAKTDITVGFLAPLVYRPITQWPKPTISGCGTGPIPKLISRGPPSTISP